MPRYAITERAGPFVAAHRNTGVGTLLELTERQAEHELRLGTLVARPIAGEATTEAPGDMPVELAPSDAEDLNATTTTRKQKRPAT
jgi:hypothetical protein